MEVTLDLSGVNGGTWQEGRVTRFQSYAFKNSEAAVYRRAEAEAKHRAAEQERERIEAEKRKEMARMLFGEDVQVTEEEVRNALEAEFHSIKMPPFVRRKEQVIQIRAILEESHLDICAAFKFYGGLGDDVEADHKQSHAHASEEDDDSSISFGEFATFCSRAKIIDGEQVSTRTLHEIFRAVNAKVEVGTGGASFKVKGDMSFDRAEFMEAFIFLARYKFPKDFGGDPAMQLDHLMKAHVSEHAEHLKPSEFRSRMAEGDCARLLLESLDLLKSIFGIYLRE